MSNVSCDAYGLRNMEFESAPVFVNAKRRENTINRLSSNNFFKSLYNNKKDKAKKIKFKKHPCSMIFFVSEVTIPANQSRRHE
ncbi:hypothetical protein FACS189449_08720 [Alphaproteobacteria bacterium]|nr:hypothetical protein FACS189449_08720 [Alphaproteobacteria bacterium]